MATLTKPPSPVFNLPNQLTFLRLGLAVVLFVLIDFEQWLGCLLVFIVAAITDWLDGYFARKQGLVSTLGRNLDPLVDKVLICGAYIFLVPVKGAELRPWMATLVVARELIITSLRSFLENRGANFGADTLGKIKMVLQCAALIAIFVALQVSDCCPGQSVWVAPLHIGLIYAMLLATALSGLQYLWRAAALLKTDT
jgi:CDP-diacylglycerol--glycerol-3-phosphate 3-phosphatidyltransferase